MLPLSLSPKERQGCNNLWYADVGSLPLAIILALLVLTCLISILLCIQILSVYFLSLPAPDEPNFLSQYSMADGTDFAQQTRAVNVIDDIIISELSRIICYNQSIYDDIYLEQDEYAGLTLGVIDMNNFGKTTTLTIVEPMYDQAAILIVDNDGECDLVFFMLIFLHANIF